MALTDNWAAMPNAFLRRLEEGEDSDECLVIAGEYCRELMIDCRLEGDPIFVEMLRSMPILFAEEVTVFILRPGGGRSDEAKRRRSSAQ